MPETPSAPVANRIFTSFPTLSNVDGPVFTFPNGPTRPRTPPPATRSSTYSTFSDPDTEESLSSPTTSVGSKDSDASHYPSTPPSSLFYLAPCPPPRPPRSRFRPPARLLSYDSPSPAPLDQEGVEEQHNGADDSDAESSIDAPAFSCPSTPARSSSRRRQLTNSPSPSPNSSPAARKPALRQLLLARSSVSIDDLSTPLTRPMKGERRMLPGAYEEEEEGIEDEMLRGGFGSVDLPKAVSEARRSWILDGLKPSMEEEEEREESNGEDADADAEEENLALELVEKLLWR